MLTAIGWIIMLFPIIKAFFVKVLPKLISKIRGVGGKLTGNAEGLGGGTLVLGDLALGEAMQKTGLLGAIFILITRIWGWLGRFPSFVKGLFADGGVLAFFRPALEFLVGTFKTPVLVFFSLFVSSLFPNIIEKFFLLVGAVSMKIFLFFSNLEKEKEYAKKLREEYEAFKLKSEKELKEKLSRAEKDAEDMVKKAQQMISGAKVSAEYIFDRLDKLQKEKDSKDFGKMYADAKKDLRNRLNEADDIYNPVEQIGEDYVLPRPLVKGDAVILKNLGTEGVLLDNPDKQGNVNVKSGIAKTKTNISNLILVTEKKKDDKKDKPQSKTRAIVSKDFSISIDVRGKNVEEAWIDIDKYFDEALYSGIKSVTVVHGKGTGLLRDKNKI